MSQSSKHDLAQVMALAQVVGQILGHEKRLLNCTPGGRLRPTHGEAGEVDRRGPLGERGGEEGGGRERGGGGRPKGTNHL